ncbi:hypothetical protein Tco_0305556, partial [Tanacetum coccineum]
MEGVKPSCRRCVFVQTGTGCVLGMDLDRGGPTKILGHVSFKNTTQKISVEPAPIRGGHGGAYYFRNSRGESVADDV